MKDQTPTPTNDNDELRRYNEALEFELSGVERGRENYLTRFSKASLSNTDTGHELKKMLLSDVQQAIEARIAESAANPRSLPSWLDPKKGAYINTPESRQLAELVLMVVMDSVNKELNERRTHELIGEAFSALVFACIMERNAEGRRLMKRLNIKLREMTGRTDSRIKWMNQRLDEVLLANEQDKEDNPRRSDHVWRKAADWGYKRAYFTENECAKIGAMLFGCMVEATNFIEVKKVLKDNDSHPTKYVFFTDIGAEFVKTHSEVLADNANYFPVMLQRPRAWGLDNIGAYEAAELAIQTPVARKMSREQTAYMEYAIRHGHFDDCLTAINSIQDVAYTINEYVLSAIDWAMEQELTDDIKSFPNLTKQPQDERLSEKEFLALEKDEQIELARDAYDIFKENLATKANATNVKTHIAEAKKIMEHARKLDPEDPKFWLPHNFDYRGRVYHVPVFGHHNTDYLRGLFLFADKQPIKQEDMKYLMLQVANTYGQDKVSLEERQKWVEKHEAEIIACGTDFKTPEAFSFWSKASDPFQFLAAAHELANAMEHGEGYMSGLPVALDATQSGVQHYAASLLHHDDGAKVNLTPNDVPADLYLACLDVALDIIEQRLAQNKDDQLQKPINDNDKEAKATLDAFLDTDATKNAKKRRKERFAETEAGRKFKRDRYITNAENLKALDPDKWENSYGRSVIKRNAMTYAYSSRKFGFSQQLKSDWLRPLTREWRKKNQKLKEEGKQPIPHPFGSDKGFSLATWLADIHQDAIEATVESVRDGMKFFQDITTILADATDKGMHLRFVTPMNFPMYQKYRRRQTRHQEVFMFDRATEKWAKDYNSYYGQYTDEIDRDKSRNGVAPNMIHAMDATHLMKTVLYCRDMGVDNLMLVHDSFATNVADVGKMAAAVRQAFVDLYDGYCLYTDLLEQAKAQHPDPDSVTWPEIPAKGDPKLDIFGVILSDYAFS